MAMNSLITSKLLVAVLETNISAYLASGVNVFTSSDSAIASLNLVRITPGATQFTRIWLDANSTASVRLRPLGEKRIPDYNPLIDKFKHLKNFETL